MDISSTLKCFRTTLGNGYSRLFAALKCEKGIIGNKLLFYAYGKTTVHVEYHSLRGDI